MGLLSLMLSSDSLILSVRMLNVGVEKIVNNPKEIKEVYLEVDRVEVLTESLKKWLTENHELGNKLSKWKQSRVNVEKFNALGELILNYRCQQIENLHALSKLLAPSSSKKR